MIHLAARLALRGGREPLIRLVVTAIGVALGVTLLLLAAAAFPALHAHDVRRAWVKTSTRNLRPAQREADTQPLLWRVRTDTFENHDIIWVDVAALGPRAPLPPGLARLPGPGDLAVSPALSRLLRSTPRALLGDRFPGRVMATVGNQALVSPDQLVIFAGHDPAELRASIGVIQVRSIESATPGLKASGFLRVMVVIGIVGLLVPVAVFVATATRLAAARREQRLAALRLVGATPRQTAVIAAVEVTLAAAAGTGLGFAAFAVARPVVARIPFDGSSFLTSDLRLPAGMSLLVVLGVPVLAACAALVSLRRVQVSPLGIVRRAAPRRPTWRRLTPLFVGLAAFGVAIPAAVSTRSGNLLPPVALGAAFLLVIVGIVAAGPLLTLAVAGVMERFGRRVAALLAARRLQDDPAAGFRAISGLVLATFVATLISGVAPAALVSYKSGSQLPAGLVTLRFTELPSRALPPAEAAPLLSQLDAIPGVVRVTDIRLAPSGSAGAAPGGAGQVVPTIARCADLLATRLAANLAACAHPSAAVSWSLADGVLDGPASMLPRPTSEPSFAALPLAAVAVSTDGRAATVERVCTRLDAAAPAGDVLAAATRDTTAGDRKLLQLERLTNVALLLSLLIAGCSLAVAVAAGLIERKRPFALLRLAGVHRSVLRRVVLAEAAIPLLAITTASVALGLGAAAALLLAGSSAAGVSFTWQPPAPGYWAALGAGLTLALLVVAATLPLLERLTSLETARFE
ncbi:MAG TPA: FtsX-like permease family protein [Actinomycetes bacterium]